MSDTEAQQDYSSAAVGWTIFAAVMMLLIGAWHVIAGLVALIDGEDFYVLGQEWVFQFNVTTWGWVHLIAGIIVVIAGVGLFSGNIAARAVAVALVALSALGNFMWLPYQPVWSIAMITVSVFVIWALTVHGRDIKLADIFP